MDRASRDSLLVEAGYPVKIRKNFRWQVGKALNRFGNVSLVAFSVTLGLAGQTSTQQSWLIPDQIATGGLAFWVAWSVFTASKYKGSNER